MEKIDILAEALDVADINMADAESVCRDAAEAQREAAIAVTEADKAYAAAEAALRRAWDAYANEISVLLDDEGADEGDLPVPTLVSEYAVANFGQ